METIELNKFNEALKNYGELVIDKMAKDLSSKGSKKLYKEFKSELDNDDGVSITMPYKALYVDSGRSAGKMPPISAIQEWVEERKLPIDSVWAIAKSIAANGVKGKDFIRIFEDNIDILVNTLAEAVVEDVSSSIQEQVKNNV